VRRVIAKRGIAKASGCAEVGAGQGCVEMASDAHIDNTYRCVAHESLGFRIERAILFVRRGYLGRALFQVADGFGLLDDGVYRVDGPVA